MGLLENLNSKRYELISFLLPLIVLVVSFRGTATAFDNVATQYSIWKTGSVGLGSLEAPIASHIANVSGTFLYNGIYYNIHAPGFQYISLPFAILGFLHEGGLLVYPAASATIADDAFLSICVALSSLVVYKICLMYASKIPSLLAGLTLAFGTLAWPFSTVTFDHDLTMLLSLLGVYCSLLTVKRKSSSTKKLLLLSAVGFTIGLSCFVEYLAILLIIPISGYLLHSRKKIQLRVTHLSILVPTLSIGPLLALLYNQVIFGDPLIFPEQFWQYYRTLGSQGVLARFDFWNVGPVILYNLFSPYRGLFLFSPVLLLGVYGLYRMYRNRIRADSILFLSLFLAGLIPYSAWSDWQGGFSYGPRFLLDVIPFLVIPIAYALYENKSKLMGGTYLALFIVSSFLVGAGAFTGATPPSQNNLFYYPPIHGISNLLGRELNVWWIGNVDSLLALAIVGVAFLVIWAAATWLTFRFPDLDEINSTSDKSPKILPRAS